MDNGGHAGSAGASGRDRRMGRAHTSWVGAPSRPLDPHSGAHPSNCIPGGHWRSGEHTPTITDPTTWALDRESSSFESLTPHAKRCSPSGPMQKPSAMVRFRSVHLHCPRMDVAREVERASTWLPKTARCSRCFDYLEVVPVERLVLDHGSDSDDDPARFRMRSSWMNRPMERRS